LRINEQSAQIDTCAEIVRGTEQFHAAEAEESSCGCRPGDGGALLSQQPEAPVLCAGNCQGAKESSESGPHGIHSGPVNEVTDLNERRILPAPGSTSPNALWIAARRYILVSKHAAEDSSSTTIGNRIWHISANVKATWRRLTSKISTMMKSQLRCSRKMRRNAISGTVVVAAGGNAAATDRSDGNRALIVVGATAFFFATRYRYRGLREAADRFRKKASLSCRSKTSATINRMLLTDGIQTNSDPTGEGRRPQGDFAQFHQKYRACRTTWRVGKQLGVAHVLEGSVQKVANAVHRERPADPGRDRRASLGGKLQP